MSNIYQLSDRGFLRIEGPDAVKFLQGYTTCDLSALADGEHQTGAICTIKGRMLTSFIVAKRGTSLYLRTDRPLVEKTIAFLQKYIVFSKAEMSDMSEDLVCYGLLGETDIDVGDGFEIDLGNRVELWLPASRAVKATSDTAAWLNAEIDSGTAWVTDATSEEFLPQMFNYHERGAIDFEKGCYLGQEIVARAQYRGELKRRLHRMVSEKQRTIGDRIDGGVVVASAPAGQLAVIQNAEEEAITVSFEDGEEVQATPF